MRLLVAVACLLLIIAAILFYGGRLIVSRHEIGKFKYALNSLSEHIEGNTIWTGVELALQKHGLNSGNWFVAPSSRWQISDSLARTNVESTLIILSNRVDGAKLYTRVSFVSSNVLEYDLYRPK